MDRRRPPVSPTALLTTTRLMVCVQNLVLWWISWEKERPYTTTKETAWSHTWTPVAPSSTSTNLAFSTTCATETRDKISTCKTAAPFNKKTARNKKTTHKLNEILLVSFNEQRKVYYLVYNNKSVSKNVHVTNSICNRYRHVQLKTYAYPWCFLYKSSSSSLIIFLHHPSMEMILHHH